MMRKKTILVTGPAGFIGSNFVKQFKIQFPKIEIVGIDDFSTGKQKLLDKEIIFYKGSILDEKLLKKIFSKHKPEFVFHFAAVPRVSFSVENPSLTTKVNIIGTVNLLEFSKNFGVKRFIYSASSSVYGGAKKMPTRELENFPDPKSPYAIQKYTGEMFCKVFSQLFNLDTISLRYFTVFGPGQYGDSPYATIISAWLESLYFPKNKKAFLEGDGRQSRDFCYIDNVVLANILAMKSKADFKGEAFNITHGERTTLNKLKKLIEKHTGKKLVLEKRSKRPGDVRDTFADISKAKKFLNYSPVVDFETGLKKTIEWFSSRKT